MIDFLKAEISVFFQRHKRTHDHHVAVAFLRFGYELWGQVWSKEFIVEPLLLLCFSFCNVSIACTF